MLKGLRPFKLPCLKSPRFKVILLKFCSNHIFLLLTAFINRKSASGYHVFLEFLSRKNPNFRPAFHLIVILVYVYADDIKILFRVLVEVINIEISSLFFRLCYFDLYL